MSTILGPVSDSRLTTGLGQSVSEILPISLSSKELASLFLFLSSHVGVDSFISNISLGSSYGWYFKVTQFELLFLGLLMLQICLLRYIEILPLNINNLFLGDPSGKRRRRALDVCRKDELAESMMKILMKLDDGECLPFVLCQLQALSQPRVLSPGLDFKIPKETKLLLSALRQSRKSRMKSGDCKSSENMVYFEDAVNVGESLDNKYSNSTLCSSRYSTCPMTSEDLVHYLGTIVKADML